MKINISISAAPFVLDKADLRWVKRDPHGFADSLTDGDLVNLIKTCNTEYTNHGTSQLNDKQYDVVLKELETRKPNHVLLKKVGAAAPSQAVTGRKKVKLPYPMFSLDKAKPDNGMLEKWLATHPGPYCVSDKEDGVSEEDIYDDGVPNAAYTRGNGLVGQDITHLIPYLGIPLSIPFKKRFVVRKELAITEAAFNKHFSKEKSITTGKKYENARNLVAGVVNTLNKKHAALDHLGHYAYEIIEPRMKPSDALVTLKKYGFQVVPWVKRNTLTAEWLTAYLLKRKAASPIEIDGLVIEQDIKTKRPTSGNPDYMISWKVQEDADTAIAEVVNVVYQTSKHGKLKPVLLIKIPGTTNSGIRLKGVTIKRVTAHNGKLVLDKKIGPGSLIRIARSGDVIPKILEVTGKSTTGKAQLPEVPYELIGADFFLKDIKGDATVKSKRITDFFVVLGVDFLKQGTVQKLIDSGLDSILKIIRAKPSDFLQVPGIQTTGANKLYVAIQDKVSKPISLPTLMKASGHFSIGMGERRLSAILKIYPNVLNDYVIKGEDYVFDKVVDIPGFQATTANVFVDGIPGYLKWFKASGLKTASLEETKIKATSSSLKGHSVGFTGFRDKDLALKIQQAGGELTNGVTSTTTILLISSAAFTSSKVDKAQAKGITIMTADQFTKKFKL